MESKPHPHRVLLLCLGNICRSPTAEGILKARAEARGVLDLVTIDSAGTAGYHQGEGPDPRTVRAAHGRGYDLSPLRSRQLTTADFQDFDEILAMDEANLADARALLGDVATDCQLKLFLDYAPDQPVREVPDPYYGGSTGFETVLDLCETAADGWLDAKGFAARS